MNDTNFVLDLVRNAAAVLAASDDKAIAYFAARDILNQKNGTVSQLWDLPQAAKIVRKQKENGSWTYPGGNSTVRSKENYDLLETYRNLGFLVECYGFDKKHPAIPKAAEFIFSFCTKQGDIRGILGNQYSPYYTAALVELLVKCGYTDTPEIEAAYKWLGNIRQHDGGWAIPLRTRHRNLDAISMSHATIEPDLSQPFSHLVTGVVLRAYAAHPTYRRAPEAVAAARLLASSLFKKDNYPDRGTADFWLRFTFPFWFTDLVSALDTLSKLGFDKEEIHIQVGVEWLIQNQDADGLWRLKILKNKTEFQTQQWISLAICRILKRLYEPQVPTKKLSIST